MSERHESKAQTLEEERVYIGESETPQIDDENNSNNNLTQFKDEVDDYYKKKKTKKKLIIFGVIFALLVGGIVGYNTLNNNYMMPEGEVERQGDVFLFKDNNSFTLDGVTYSLPLKAKDFINNGWTIIFDHEEDKTDIIEIYDTVYVTFQKDGKEFEASLTSFEDKEISIEDGDIDSININNNRTPDFIGPLNLSIGENTDKVIEKIQGTNYAYNCDYYKSTYSESYYFSLKDNQLDKDYYYAYYINCYDGKLNAINIYYSFYN